MAEWAIYTSVLTISAFSVERYLAICHPFQARKLSQCSRASRTIPVIWLLGFLGALTMSLQLGLRPPHLLDFHSLCTVITDFAPHALGISSVVFFVLPMTLIGCLYTRIGMSLRKSELAALEGKKNANCPGNGSRVTRMLGESLFGVSVSFGVYFLARGRVKIQLV